MTKKIFKYPLKITDEQTVEMPERAKIITVQNQGNGVDGLCLWALVNPYGKEVKRTIRIYGTGHPIEIENLEYIGTTQQREGLLVWHVFEVIGIHEYFVKMAGLNK